MKRTLLLITAALFCCGMTANSSTRADEVTDWNELASEVLLADSLLQNPGMASRSMAMMNLAIYDAVNGINPTHQQMYSHTSAPAGASVQAAAVQAAYRVLSSIYPDQQAMIDTGRTNSLASIADGAAKTDGINFGETVANNIINARAGDGYMNMVPYTPSGDPGHWEADPLNPSQVAWGPEWGGLNTFAISNSDQFMVSPPPALTSQEYADAFNEVKALGSKNNSTRTDDQTEIGLFWAYDRLGMGTPMRMYNKIMRDVATDQGNTLSENARLFAMASTSMADAGIVAWDSKFEYDHWRPVSGIRRANEDGNPMTSPDENWEPLGAPGGIAPDGTPISDFTPPFPTFLSGHASFGSAFFATMENFYGTDDVAFDATSDEVPGVTRSYTSFSQANEENGRSRVYLGIHWSYDDTMAREMGDDLADFVTANHFLPVPEPSSMSLLGLGLLWFVRARRRRRSS